MAWESAQSVDGVNAVVIDKNVEDVARREMNSGLCEGRLIEAPHGCVTSAGEEGDARQHRLRFTVQVRWGDDVLVC